MSAQCETTAKRATGAPMSLFERWLTLWVALCIVARRGARPTATSAIPGPRSHAGSPGQYTGRSSDLGDDHTDADED